jgi:hypothetical protein
MIPLINVQGVAFETRHPVFYIIDLFPPYLFSQFQVMLVNQGVSLYTTKPSRR